MTTREDLIALHEVLRERGRQDAKWGEQNHPDGTGPGEEILSEVDVDLHSMTGTELADAFTRKCDRQTEAETLTWRDIMLEETFEAMAEEPGSRALGTEVTQSVAVGFGWLGSMLRNSNGREGLARRAFVAGPIVDDEDCIQAFEERAGLLVHEEYFVLTPFDIEPFDHDGPCPFTGRSAPIGPEPGEMGSHHTSAACYLRTALITMLTCDELVLMVGWGSSYMSKVLHEAACACGLKVRYP